MSLRMFLAVSSLFLTAGLPAAALDARPPVAAAPTARQEAERLRTDMEGQVERMRLSLDKAMAEERERIDKAQDKQDKRISDLQLHIARTNDLIALMAMIITIAVVGIAFKFGRDAKRKAIEAGKAEVKKWRKKAETKLEEDYKTYRRKMQTLLDAAQEHHDHIQGLRAVVNATVESLSSVDAAKRNGNGTPNGGAGTCVSDVVCDGARLAEAVERARAKPELERDFEDWYCLAWSVLNDDPLMAMSLFCRARAVGTTDRLLSLKAVFNAAVAAQKAQQRDDVIRLTEAAIAQWRDSGVEGGEPMAIASYLSRVSTLIDIRGRAQEALDVAEAALAFDWDISNETTRRGWERLKLKRAIALQKLKRGDEAEPLYDAFIEQHRDTADNALRRELAAAHFNKMLLRRRAGDRAGMVSLIDIIEARFAGSDDPFIINVVQSARQRRPQPPDLGDHP